MYFCSSEDNICVIQLRTDLRENKKKNLQCLTHSYAVTMEHRFGIKPKLNNLDIVRIKHI